MVNLNCAVVGAVPHVSEDLVFLKRNSLARMSSTLKYKLKCCIPLQIEVGQFFSLDAMTVPIFAHAILNYTISAIMSF